MKKNSTIALFSLVSSSLFLVSSDYLDIHTSLPKNTANKSTQTDSIIINTRLLEEQRLRRELVREAVLAAGARYSGLVSEVAR